jgi:hypothetical protein
MYSYKRTYFVSIYLPNFVISGTLVEGGAVAPWGKKYAKKCEKVPFD